MAKTIIGTNNAVKPVSVKLIRAALIWSLVTDCLSIKASLVRDLNRDLGLSLAQIEERKIRSVPCDRQNAIISSMLLDRYGAERLAASGLFYCFNRAGCVCDCEGSQDGCTCDLPSWRLDVDPRYERGLLVPIINTVGLYTHLLVYRTVEDTSPFALRVRADLEVAA